MSSPVRARLLSALAASIEDLGWEKTTTAEVVRRAKTSKRSFYQAFSSREEAFCALYEHEAAALQAALLAALAQHQDPHARVDAGLAAYVEHFQARPRLLREMLLGPLHLGAQGVGLRRRNQQAFVALLSHEMVRGGLSAEQAPLLARVFVGGANDMLLEAVEDPERPQLDTMKEKLRLAFSALSPQR
ncbi:MAG: TetR/AcrR family transcriptional regulator [Myxococcota bacterium]|nr:TetR/AcrR family transcriptional regulator [Myxococcota bacterium]